ncbi:MAG TPA: tetratricopeptide repeat protein [bacterium]|nr:tetratricopeptide repeat protein [bacterium]HQJ63348.1 tetratricopeptide repeat protein [bacterium]
MKKRNKYALVLAILAVVLPVAAQNLQEFRRMQLRAQQLEALGRFDEAGELYGRAALGLAPLRDLNAYSSARHCYERVQAFQEWETLILALQKSYRTLLFEVDLGEIAWLRGEHPEALQRWRQIMDENPLNEQAYALVGNVLMKYTLYGEAQELYERGRKVFRDPEKFFVELVRVYAGLGAFDRMTGEYLHFLQKNPGQTGYVQSQLLSAAEEPEASVQIITAIERALRDDENLKEEGYALLAALYTQQRAYGKALDCYDYLEERMGSRKSGEAGGHYYTLAMVALNDSALVEARSALEKLLTRTDEKNPYRPKAAFALAQLLEKEGAYDKAAAGYADFIRAYPDHPELPALYLRLGNLYFEHFFKVKAADSVYAVLLQRQPPSAIRLLALQKRAECAVARGDLGAARDFLQMMKRDAPLLSGPQRQADLMLARIDLYEGRPGRALQKLETIVNGPKMQGVAADTVQNDILDLLLLLRESRHDSLGCAHYGKSLWLQQQRHYTAALDTLMRLQGPGYNKSLEERAQFLRIDLLRRLRRDDEALAVCTALSQDSTSLEPDLALLVMARIHEQRGEAQKARQLLESFLEKYPESIYIEQVRGRIRLLERIKPVMLR